MKVINRDPIKNLLYLIAFASLSYAASNMLVLFFYIGFGSEFRSDAVTFFWFAKYLLAIVFSVAIYAWARRKGREELGYLFMLLGFLFFFIRCFIGLHTAGVSWRGISGGNWMMKYFLFSLLDVFIYVAVICLRVKISVLYERIIAFLFPRRAT